MNSPHPLSTFVSILFILSFKSISSNQSRRVSLMKNVIMPSYCNHYDFIKYNSIIDSPFGNKVPNLPEMVLLV